MCFLVMTVVLAVTIIALRVVDRSLEPNDRRRRLASRVVLYGGTALLIALLLELRQ